MAEHLELLASYVPAIQVNFMFGLDTDVGNEPVELTKEFMSNPNQIFLDTKVSCKENSVGSIVHCGLIYYENSSNDIIFAFTDDLFDTSTLFTVRDFDFTLADAESNITRWHLPIDVIYSSGTDSYNIVVMNQTFQFDPTLQTMSTISGDATLANRDGTFYNERY